MSSLPTSLVQSAVDGDHASLVALLKAARPDIRRYARAACRADDVDDAVQQTLWLLYRRIGTLRAVTSVSAWLLTIVRRQCLQLTRSLGFTASDDLDAEHHALAKPDDTLRLDLANAIQSLPPHYRSIVVMRDIEERTVDEIAQALGTTRETVKARLHRARALLREYLLR